ncbi:MAG TPA: AI-2E family transporter [Savagea sp.]
MPFLGGMTTLYVLASILLIGLIIFVFDKVSFVFTPLRVFFSTVVLPIILATILYYLLRPILRLLEKIHIKRAWGILIIFVGGIGLITLFVFLIFPFLKAQFTNLVEEFPTYFKKLTQDIDYFLSHSSIFASYYNDMNVNVSKFFDGSFANIGKTVGNTLGSVASGVSNFIGALTGIVLSIATVPFILFYLLKDGEKLPAVLVKMLPPRMRPDAKMILQDADRQISAYIQGQIIVAFCIGVMVSIGFFIIGMKYALLLGVIAMFTSVVPYLGAAIAITPAAIIALVSSPWMLVKLIVVWTVVQLIDGKFISPQVMGKSLKIHPITIIFVLLTSGSLFGVAGVILGIPGYAVLKVLVTHLFDLYKLRYNRYQPDVLMHYDLTERMGDTDSKE